MTDTRSHALLIGVTDYSTFDDAAGNAPGTSDLPSAAHDVDDVQALLRRLRVAPRNIDRIGAAPVGPRRRSGRPATRQAILEAVRRFAVALGRRRSGRGFLYFTGHGVEGEHPTLCASDFDGTQGMVTLPEISAVLDEHAPRRSVTVIIDACFAGLRPPTDPADAAATWSTIAARPQDLVLASSASDLTSAQVVVHGGPRGAFTWALARVLEQICRVRAGRYTVLDLTYEAVRVRVASLLRAMGVPQEPVFRGPLRGRYWPFGHPVGQRAIQTLGRLRALDDKEIWPGDEGIVYELVRPGGALLGWLEVPHGSPSSDVWYTHGDIDLTAEPEIVMLPTDLEQVPQDKDPVLQGAWQAGSFSDTVASASLPSTAFEILGENASGETPLGWLAWPSYTSAQKWFITNADQGYTHTVGSEFWLAADAGAERFVLRRRSAPTELSGPYPLECPLT